MMQDQEATTANLGPHGPDFCSLGPAILSRIGLGHRIRSQAAESRASRHGNGGTNGTVSAVPGAQVRGVDQGTFKP
jgi:hypothetical protein